jgi:AcrR family transcriptional regulator
MTEKEIQDTKEKILRAGRELFALKGYEGTSIRDIALHAEVNLAAINYHFSSKENLFRQIMVRIKQETQQAIELRRLKYPNETTSDLAVWYFRYFLEKSDVLRSVFKLFLSENYEPNEELMSDKFGPPGGMVFAQAIMDELKRPVSEENMFWAVKVVFSHVVHAALMFTNHFCKLTSSSGYTETSEKNYYSQATIESDIRRLVKIVLNDL